MRLNFFIASCFGVIALMSSATARAGDSGGAGSVAYTSSQSLPSGAAGEIVNMLTSLNGTLVYKSGNMQMAPIKLSNLSFPLSPAANVSVASGGTSGTLTVTDSRFPRMVASVTGSGMFRTTGFTVSNVNTGLCGNWKVSIYSSGSGCTGSPSMTLNTSVSGSNCVAAALGDFTGSLAVALDTFHSNLPSTACTTI